jgi:hypothetical protein
MSAEHPSAADTLYLDAEHFILTAESGCPLEPGRSVAPVGRPFAGLIPRENPADPARPAGSEETSA